MGISYPNSNAGRKSCRSLRSHSHVSGHKRQAFRLRLEQLESRRLLAGDFDGGSGPSGQAAVPPAPITWFESYDEVRRVPIESLTDVDPVYETDFQGPRELAVGEWIVQLTDGAARNVRVLEAAKEILDDDPNRFTIIAGLGAKGLVLVRGEGVSAADIQSSLQRNAAVESFSLNSMITGQSITPNESDFAAGLLDGLTSTEAPIAWEVSTGSMQTVVGVVDSGIDLDHPDLYLNIWLNQGEIPAAIKGDLEDIDGDGLVTFYDLNNLRVIGGEIYVASSVVSDGNGNFVSGDLATASQLTTETPYASGANASYVTDLAGRRGSVNGRIDALDLLADPRWSDGRDTDANGFFDDLFGVNFRNGAEEDFAANEPDDALGHGTHVAGTIGAVGNNHTGVVGVNWHTSLMSLRILDNNNRSDAGAGLRAVNYAKMMRERHVVDDDNRTVEGADLRVLNNSWGQPSGYELALEIAISELGEVGVLFVAAAGNGDIFGNGVDNDQTPFYPASYNVDNVIAVAASTSDDHLATFSNFGRSSVDIAAPGTGVRSTLKDGAYGTANGTSMAAPHVSGTAALVWSAFPQATVDEIRAALLSELSVEPLVSGPGLVHSGGRLSVSKAMGANVFAPSATVIAKENIAASGGATTEFTIRYRHRDGIDLGSIDDDDVIVTRQWGISDEISVSLKPGSKAATADGAVATYVMDAPGQSWDALDFGEYVISTVGGNVKAAAADVAVQKRDIGSFRVKIEDDPSIIYVDSFVDSLAPGSLRSAINAANAAAPFERTILLESGTYTIDLEPDVDPASAFGSAIDSLDLFNPGGWSDADSGDFDIEGNVRIIGDTNDDSVIDAQSFDRVFKVHPDASLELARVTVSGGFAPARQGGGGILSVGELDLHQVIVRENFAVGGEGTPERYGGGIAVWGGMATLNESWLTENQSDFGGGIFFSGEATGVIQRSTLDHNLGGGLYSLSSNDVDVTDSTFSANSGGWGSVANGFLNHSAHSGNPALSSDGRYVAFNTEASNLVPEDSNHTSDVLVLDQSTGKLERVSVDSAGVEGNGYSSHPSMSADGRYVAFTSDANNLVPFDTNDSSDIFVFDRITKAIDRVSVSGSGMEGNGDSAFASISDDGRYVAFTSNANNLVPEDTNDQFDVFVYDRTTATIERVSVDGEGTGGNGRSLNPSISGDGQFVTFFSDANNLVDGDTNNQFDVFVYDRTSAMIERVSVGDDGTEGNGASFNPATSGNGRYVTFHSLASNLVSGDTNNQFDVFVVDRQTDSIERVSVSDAAAQGNGQSSHPSLSADGRFVTFFSTANNLVASDTNGTADTFVYDRSTGVIERVSISSADIEGNGHSGFSSGSLLSGDGRYVTFVSSAGNLVPGDSDTLTQDVFVYDRSEDKIDAMTYRASESIVDVTHSTIAEASDALAFVTVAGEVAVRESLFAANEVFGDLDSRAALVSGQNILFSTPQADLIGPLQRQGYLPPVHPLLLGNPAIDTANPSADGTRDQLGQIRIQSDYGAVEAVTATVQGKVYFDRDQNGRLDVEEPGIEGIEVTVTGDGTLTAISSSDDLGTLLVDESGTLNLIGLAPGSTAFDAQAPAGWSVYTPRISLVRTESNLADGDSFSTSLSADGRFVAFVSQASNLVPSDTNNQADVFLFDQLLGTIERVSVNDSGVGGNGASSLPSISGDGRYVTFQSDATNLVSGDTNGVSDVFVFDRSTEMIQRISVNDLGGEGNAKSDRPAISADGRYVAFHSFANNLVTDDNNGAFDIFVYDRQAEAIERISIDDAGTEGNASSFAPSISSDGQFVAFESVASNLVPSDVNGIRDIFVYDRSAQTVQRVSVNGSDEAGNDESFAPSLSGDGHFVAFVSDADNLVANDSNNAPDVFVVERTTGEVQRISIDGTGGEGNSFSDSPSLSFDGRFVTFRSQSSNLVPNDTNGATDIFVYDRMTGAIQRASENAAGVEGDHISNTPSLSADGRTVAFASRAENLVPGADNQLSDVFTAFNPLASPSVTRDLRAGDFVADLNIGLIPNPGRISGRVFEDVVANGVYDAGEPVDIGVTVFLDLNSNRQFDEGEPFAIPDAEGHYEFSNVDAHLSYEIAATPLVGFEQATPAASEGFVWDVFLPADGSITNRDFGFRTVQATGQSTASAVSGRLFEDNNENGVYDAEIDVPQQNIPVFLDGNGDRVHTAGADEPITTTAADGTFAIAGLGSRIVSVRTSLGGNLVHNTPLGNSFEQQAFDLFSGVSAFKTPSDAAHGDFNHDGFEDLAVLLSDGNQLLIRLNDGNGGFAPSGINVSLGQTATTPGTSFPIEMVVGQFNDDSADRKDVAIVGQAGGNVLILLDFNESTHQFGSRQSIAVGPIPTSLAKGDFNKDGTVDLAVLNFGVNALVQASPPVFAKTNESFQLLINNGTGTFLPQAAVPVPGDNPVRIVADDFNDDGNLDVAVLHLSPSVPNTPFGNVALFTGNGANSFALSHVETVEGGPLDMVSGDFNGDGVADLAVANVSQNTLSILSGRTDGTIIREQVHPIGTGDKGVDSMDVADIDADGDLDIVATRLTDGSVAVFRNITDTSANPVHVKFEPLESFGLAQFSIFDRAPVVLANFDGDASGPGGQGTVDVASVSKFTAKVNVMLNRLVDGGHRVALDGLNSIGGLDFIVEPVIIPPTLNPIPNPPVMIEDGGAMEVALDGISKGFVGGPDLQIHAFSSHTHLLPHPSVSYTSDDSNALLTLDPNQHANTGEGVVTVTVEVRNAGSNGVMGDSDDGVIRESFTVTIEPVNDPPNFSIPSLVPVTQKDGPQSIDGFASGISPGGGSDEGAQGLSDFVVLADRNELFSDLPMIDVNGRLTFTPEPNRAGVAIVTVNLSDDGGRALGGLDTTTKVFAINVVPVNDPPSITLGGDLVVAVDDGPQTVTNFAGNFHPGVGEDDATQSISDYEISVDQPGLFATVPTISIDGTLSFSPQSTGTATITVQVRDDGGRGNGGNDLSAPQQFTIRIVSRPVVEAVWINDGESQSRSNVTSLTVAFSELLDHGTLADAFTLTNLDTGGVVGSINVVSVDDDGKTSTSLTFSGTSTIHRTGNNSLADGSYRLEIDAEKVLIADAPVGMRENHVFGGQTVGAANNDAFFRLFGDTDGDGDNDVQDLARFGVSFLKQSNEPGYDAELDHDGDGDVDGHDFAFFRRNYLQRSSDI